MTHSAVLQYSISEGDREASESIAVSKLIVAGWTSRDKSAMEAHIQELERLGVQRPSKTPMFYRVSATRLTTATAIQDLGESASGEVEFVLLRSGGRTFIGCGSDHTDRKAEAYSVAVSKQMCDKPIASALWPLERVYAHWEQLMLRSYVSNDGERVLYQEGSVAAMLDPKVLVESMESEGVSFDDGTVVFCGTIPAHGGVRFAERFEYSLEDPVSGESIESYYEVHPLTVAQ